MSLLAIIPARANSKRLPRKNFMLCNGKSLLQRAIECAKEAGIFDYITVSTDDDSGMRAAIDKQIGFTLRNDVLCDDEVQSAAVVFDLLAQVDYGYDAFCLLNPTSPLRTPEELREAWKFFQDHNCNSLVSGLAAHDGNFLFCRTLHFLRTLKLITSESVRLPTRDAVDINTLEDFQLAEMRMIEREGEARSLCYCGKPKPAHYDWREYKQCEKVHS